MNESSHAPAEAPALRLVSTNTEDGFTHSGLFYRPSGASKDTGIVLVHGGSQNFYQPLLQLLGQGLAQAGYPTVSGNNRGHDLGAYLQRTSGQLFLAGSAWERLEESVHDIRGWLDFISSYGVQRVVLVGHGLGAWKAAHYFAETQDRRVIGLVTCSGLRVRSPMEFKSRYAVLSQEWTMFGHGEDFLPAPAAPFRVSAQTFLDLFNNYMQDEPVDIPRITVPLLNVYGSAEGISQEELDEVSSRALHSPEVRSLMIADAGHNYTGKESELTQHILDWLHRPGQHRQEQS